MKARIGLVAAMSFLAGCAVAPLPNDPPSSPASPQARESSSPRVRSALQPDETSRAVAQRLRAVRSDTRAPPTHGGNMEGMQHGDMSHDAPPPPASAESYYTCVMHPEIHESKPGKCPKCGMDLVLKQGAPPK